VRDATARWAVLTASARVSRSHRNFTVLLPGPYSLGSHNFGFYGLGFYGLGFYGLGFEDLVFLNKMKIYISLLL
jgi:hypothetical protein